jgi:hypothetical protein
LPERKETLDTTTFLIGEIEFGVKRSPKRVSKEKWVLLIGLP